MRSKADFRPGWTPNSLSQERGSLRGASTRISTWGDFDKIPPAPLWTNLILRVKTDDAYWHEHKNYYYCAIEIPLEGDLRITQRDARVVVSPGEAGIIHRGEDSTLETGPSGFCRKIALLMTGPLLQAMLDETGLSSRQKTKIAKPDALLKRVFALERLLIEKESSSIPAICGLTAEILTALAEGIDAAKPAALSKALAIMNANLAKPVSISRLAAETSSSQSALARLFKKHLGVSPKSRYLSLRLQRAAELLANGSAPAKTIAAATGFKSSARLASEFRKKFGCSPREFRKKPRV